MLENFTTDTFTYEKLSKDEMERRGILGRLVGVIADSKNPTRNGRLYNSALWDRVFDNPIMREKIENNCVFGQLGHPEDREEVDMEKIAICMDGLPKKNSKGQLMGVFNIIDTPCGRILKSLCDYGCNIGISSRGTGDIIRDYDGNEMVDPDTYSCECFDAVLVPGVQAARLQYVTESLDKTRYKKTLRDRLTESINNEATDKQKAMRESLHDIGIDLDESLFDESVEYSPKFIDGMTIDELKAEEKSYYDDQYQYGKSLPMNRIWDIDFTLKELEKDLNESLDDKYLNKTFINRDFDGTVYTRVIGKDGDNYKLQVIDSPKTNNVIHEYSLSSDDMDLFDDKDFINESINLRELGDKVPGLTVDIWSSINEVMGAYQNANKWLDSAKEFIYSDLSCPFFSSFVHELAHTMPGRFDKFGDILHTANITIPYPTTLELDNELVSVDDVFNLIFGCLDDIKDNLNKFIELTDKEFHGMACSAEELLNDIESEYPMLFRLRDKWNQCNNDLVDFDKFVAQYVEHKEDLLESLDESNDVITQTVFHKNEHDTAIESGKARGEDNTSCDVILQSPKDKLDIALEMLEKVPNIYMGQRKEDYPKAIYYKNYLIITHTKSRGATRWYLDNNKMTHAGVFDSVSDAKKFIDDESNTLNENISYKNTDIIENEDGTFVVTINDDTQIFNSLKNAKTYIDMMQPHLKEELYVSAGKMNDKLLDDAVLDFEKNIGDYGDALTFVKNRFSQYSLNDQKDIAKYINQQLSENLKLTEAQVGRDDSKSIEDVGSEDHTPEPIPEPEKKEEKETTIIIKEALNKTEESAADAALSELRDKEDVDSSVIRDVVSNSVYSANNSDEDPLSFEEADYFRVLDYVEDKFNKKDVNDNINNIEEAVENNEADIDKIYEMFNKNAKLEKKLTDLQEQLSASYARETRLKEEMARYKNQIKQLAESSKQVEILESKLERANSQISEIENGISANEHRFNESMETNNKVKTKLTESIRERDSRIKSLEEELESTKKQNVARLNENKTLKKEYDSLQESYADAQKDVAQIKEQYSKKLDQKNELIEKYQKIANRAVDKYIESQAIRLGVTSNEIKNKLPRGYGFKDIDTICESLQEYKLNMSTLPFNAHSLNESVGLRARNVRQELLPKNEENEITDLELELASKLIKK